VSSTKEGRDAVCCLKRILGLDRLRLRGPSGVKDEFLLAATAQNPRKLAKLIPLPAPAFALVAQGAKRVMQGNQVFDYVAGQYLIFSVDLPLSGRVVQASENEPFLGFGLKLKPDVIAALLLETGGPRKAKIEPPAIAVSDLTDDLVDSVVRLLRLLDRPEDIPVLAPARRATSAQVERIERRGVLSQSIGFKTATNLRRRCGLLRAAAKTRCSAARKLQSIRRVCSAAPASGALLMTRRVGQLSFGSYGPIWPSVSVRQNSSCCPLETLRHGSRRTRRSSLSGALDLSQER
jgi:hypothetical protein